MSRLKIELLIIGFILLIGTASAVMPTKITITSSADSDSHNGWLDANGTDQTFNQSFVRVNAGDSSLEQPQRYGGSEKNLM
jgi:hypothetical protein